jgi:hypothetical protein
VTPAQGTRSLERDRQYDFPVKKFPHMFDDLEQYLARQSAFVSPLIPQKLNLVRS